MNIRFVRNMQTMLAATALTICLGTFTTASAQLASGYQRSEDKNVQNGVAPVLESNPNTKKMEAAIYQYFENVQTLNPQTFANAFAPDGTLEDPVGAPPVQGRPAISAFFAGITQPFGRAIGRVKDIYVGAGNSNDATASWTLTLYTKQGKQVILHGIGVFTFKPSNPNSADPMQIASLREFYDPIELLSQLL